MVLEEQHHNRLRSNSNVIPVGDVLGKSNITYYVEDQSADAECKFTFIPLCYSVLH